MSSRRRAVGRPPAVLTIVMYHYVRDVERTAFPGIKARAVAEFASQLDYLERHYQPVRLDDVRAAYAGERTLPERAFLLTFDDGLAEHRDVVVPELARRGLGGCFSPPAAMVLERRVADVQKSQFVLAASPDRVRLVDRLFESLEPHVDTGSVSAPEELRRRYGHADRFDDAETMLAKHLLQHALADGVRRSVLDTLFAELVSDDERAFADELYLTLDDVRALARQGMDIVGHGVEHRQLGLLDAEQQQREIAGTCAFLEVVLGYPPERWAICYPSGSYDATTVELVAAAGCAIGFVDTPGLARLDESSLTLPRLDTNDLPVAVDAEPATWTLDAAAASG